jgi:hypothetical protein
MWRGVSVTPCGQSTKLPLTFNKKINDRSYLLFQYRVLNHAFF